jgi:hypothetical protein
MKPVQERDLMYILNTRRESVQLARLDTEILEDPATGRTTVAVTTRRGHDPANASALVARAARAFFGIGGQQLGKAAVAVPQAGPPPVVFRETASGLLHVVYREIVVRFTHAISQKRRRDILKEGGFRVRRVNSFVPDQMVVYDPRRRHSGEDLVEVSNRWMELDEVVFATPNFVSQFLRQGPPSIRSEEWHLRNKGGSGAKAGEDVDVTAAWKKTTGDTRIVVAVLDDGGPVAFPARDSNAIAVGASTDQGKRASYSNIGPRIAFVAPSSGGIRGIFTTDVSLENRGFNVGREEQGGEDGLHTNSFGGTSAATALAAGVAALVLSVNPDLSRSDLRDPLARTADKIGPDHDSQGHSNQLGFGRINAGKAVAEARRSRRGAEGRDQFP